MILLKNPSTTQTHFLKKKLLKKRQIIIWAMRFCLTFINFIKFKKISKFVEEIL